MKHRRHALAATAFGLGLGLTACSSGPVVPTTLSYCSPDGIALHLDVFRPDPAPSAPVGAVVYVHGGGWVSGTDALFPLMRSIEEEVVAAGDIFVSLNYQSE
jgi:acetyl esterase/lipase